MEGTIGGAIFELSHALFDSGILFLVHIYWTPLAYVAGLTCEVKRTLLSKLIILLPLNDEDVFDLNL